MRDELSQHVIRLVQLALFMLALWVIGWGLTPWASFFLGLIVGTSIGLLNALYTAWKVRRVTALEGRPRFSSLGTAVRLSMAVLGALIALESPQVDLLGTVLGLVVLPFVSLLDNLIMALRQ